MFLVGATVWNARAYDCRRRAEIDVEDVFSRLLGWEQYQRDNPLEETFSNSI